MAIDSNTMFLNTLKLFFSENPKEAICHKHKVELISERDPSIKITNLKDLKNKETYCVDILTNESVDTLSCE